MALTTAQQTQLANGLKAETDAGVVAAMAARDDVGLSAWCNAAGPTDAWNKMTGLALFALTDVPKFDGITQGKRDSWRLMLDFEPIDFSAVLMRQAVTDIWGGANRSVAILQGCRRKATHGEMYLGGTIATQEGVSATVLNVPGFISLNEMSQALNANP